MSQMEKRYQFSKKPSVKIAVEDVEDSDSENG